MVHGRRSSGVPRLLLPPGRSETIQPSIVEPALSTPSRLRGLVSLLRPRQWAKNLLVFAAPLAAGSLTDPQDLGAAVLAFVVFTMAAAGTYALNDVADREADAAHPTKRARPVAAGHVEVRTATILGIALAVGAVVLPVLVGLLSLALFVLTYLVLTSAYSAWLKHVTMVDIAIVAAGFLLRAMAGAVAGGIPMSRWFLVVVGFGSVYVVANKRAAEHRAAGGDGAAGGTRAALVGYSTELLREIRFISAAVTIVGYVSWALARASEAFGGDPWATLSIAPFTFGVFRYAAAVDAGLGEAPEEILLRDRVLQLLGLIWIVVFAAAVHVG